MKILSRYKLSFFNALITSVIVSFAFWIFNLINTKELWLAVIVIFGAAISVSLLIFELSVYRKIRKIKKLIVDSHDTNRQALGLEHDIILQLEQEVKSWTKERKEESARLEKLETYRKEFLGNISHELKTPVFNIQGYIHTLLDGAIDDPSVNRDYLTRTANSVERMITIIEDLQTITQLERGELILEEENFDLAELCKDVIQSQELNAKANNISLEYDFDSAQKIIVNADRFRIRQALVNLVVNSIKYGRIDGNTRIKISDAGEKIIVEISDNGLGISKLHLPRIFERFYRVDKSRSRELGGSGLGLSIVKHIIEAHHQSIDVLSTEDVGSVFSFSLRKAIAE